MTLRWHSPRVFFMSWKPCVIPRRGTPCTTQSLQEISQGGGAEAGERLGAPSRNCSHNHTRAGAQWGVRRSHWHGDRSGRWAQWESRFSTGKPAGHCEHTACRAQAPPSQLSPLGLVTWNLQVFQVCQQQGKCFAWHWGLPSQWHWWKQEGKTCCLPPPKNQPGDKVLHGSAPRGWGAHRLLRLRPDHTEHLCLRRFVVQLIGT